MRMDSIQILKNLIIKDEYALSYDKEKIIAGLKKLPDLFAEIGKIQVPADTDRRVIALIFYAGVLSELKDGALHMDCAALAKRYHMKSPSPGMREVYLLPNVGFTIESLRFIENTSGKKGRIDELAELVISHEDEKILLAIKVFATACTLGGRDYFSQLDFRLLAEDAPKPYKPPISEVGEMMESSTVQLLQEPRFDFMSRDDKVFITAFDAVMLERGWGLENNGHFSGYCWGRYMLIYCKLGVKAKNVIARIFLRDDGMVLRLFFSNIDKHRAFLEDAPEHIKSVFLTGHGNCNHCKGIGHREDGNCSFRKTYTLDGSLIEKCAGVVFEFYQPTMQKLPDYLALLDEFYPTKGRKSL